MKYLYCTTYWHCHGGLSFICLIRIWVSQVTTEYHFQPGAAVTRPH